MDMWQKKGYGLQHSDPRCHYTLLEITLPRKLTTEEREQFEGVVYDGMRTIKVDETKITFDVFSTCD